MITLDEAIANHKKLKVSAESNNDMRGIFYNAEEHEQLAEWLEELKKYREYINLLENPKQYQLGFQDGIVVGNNNAIDDFVNACKENVLCKTFGLRENDIEQIAEQLKACVNDE